jgi:hypothetical protein
MTRIVFISLLLLATTACDNASLRDTAEAARAAREAIAIAPERGRINGLGIGSGEAEVVAAFGPPARVEEGFDEIEGKPARTLFYDRIEIYLVGDEIYNLQCRAGNCMTHDGIRVGDPVGKASAVYGQLQPLERGEDHDALLYPLRGVDAMLVLDVKDGLIVGMELFFDYA